MLCQWASGSPSSKGPWRQYLWRSSSSKRIFDWWTLEGDDMTFLSSTINHSCHNKQWCPRIHHCKATPLQAWTGPEGSRRLRLLDFKTISTWRWKSCQPYAPATFTPQEIFLVLISVSPQCHSAATRIMSMKNSNDIIGNWTRDLLACSAVPHPTAPRRAPKHHCGNLRSHKCVALQHVQNTHKFTTNFRNPECNSLKKSKMSLIMITQHKHLTCLSVQLHNPYAWSPHLWWQRYTHPCPVLYYELNDQLKIGRRIMQLQATIKNIQKIHNFLKESV